MRSESAVVVEPPQAGTGQDQELGPRHALSLQVRDGSCTVGGVEPGVLPVVVAREMVRNYPPEIEQCVGAFTDNQRTRVRGQLRIDDLCDMPDEAGVAPLPPLGTQPTMCTFGWAAC